MVSLQIISKILATKDLSIIENNLLTEDYFVGYEQEYQSLYTGYVCGNLSGACASCHADPQEDPFSVSAVFSVLCTLCHACGHDISCHDRGDAESGFRRTCPRGRHRCRMVRKKPASGGKSVLYRGTGFRVFHCLRRRDGKAIPC